MSLCISPIFTLGGGVSAQWETGQNSGAAHVVPR